MKFGTIPVVQDDSGKSVAFFSTVASAFVSRDVIEDMIEWSRTHNDKDLRVCLHQSKEDVYQQMIILQHRRTYHRPHKEIHPESYHIIRGSMMVCLFDPEGSIQEKTIVDGENISLYRVGAGQWHTSVPLTPIVVFHETKPGPFRSTDILYPPWAPIDEKQGIAYTKRVLGRR